MRKPLMVIYHATKNPSAPSNHGQQTGTSPSVVWGPIDPSSASSAKDILKLAVPKDTVNNETAKNVDFFAVSALGMEPSHAASSAKDGRFRSQTTS